MLIRRAVDFFLKGYLSTPDRSEKTVLANTIDLAQFSDFQPKNEHLVTLTAEVFEAWAAHLKHQGYSSTT